MAIRVLIVDDHKLFAEAIGVALRREGFEDVTFATTGTEALEAVRCGAPDVVLLDIGLPDQNGLETGAAILRECPSTKVLALSALDDQSMVREAVRAGFHGYLSKDTRVLQLASSLRAVLDGRIVMPQRFPRGVGGATATARPEALLADHLTPREREVLALLAHGARSREIGERLRIAENTVRTHVRSILAKLQVHSRLEAAAFAQRHGVVDVLERRRSRSA